MNISTVNELIQSLESAGELSIKERKYLDVMRWAIRVAGERDAALNAERVWEKTMMEACGEDGPGSVANEIRSLRALRDTALTELRAQVEQLAAENKRLTDVAQGGAFVMQKALMKYEFGVGMSMQAEDFIRDAREKHPATDRIVAEAEAQGAEAYETALLTSDDDDFTYEASICVEETYQQREGAK
ncbi:hypothetical protein AB9D58_16205 [Klebsiella michiganensis]|uniref:hypothetical protein n=1 Tax=Klebsiella michiganensis TaxID=1134687 RepID=UPI00351A1578